MAYFNGAEKNVEGRISMLKRKLEYYKDPSRLAMIRREIGKYLGTIDELVEYLSLEESGLIDTTHRTPVKNVISFSKFGYSFHHLARILASIMSEIEGREYGVFSAMNTRVVPDEYDDRVIDYLNLYILPVVETNAVVSSLDHLKPDDTFESASNTSRESVIEYNNILIKRFEEVENRTGGVDMSHLLYYISEFSLLDNIDKIGRRLCWKRCLSRVCSISYLEDFLNLIVFTQHQLGRFLKIEEIQELANEFAKSYKESKFSSENGFQIPFKCVSQF